ncbi:MAG TPA: family 78 glycoside hydrolase catalytic domain, partial [Mucilaginibacter sp.]|nr:family 78 glycoside hydrolase catalytic domain [Mucilaginibacter sp.]
MKKFLVAVFTLLVCNSYAQTTPSGLMIDLVSHADYQSINGYPIPSSPNNFKNKAVQSVLIGDTHPTFSWEVNSAGKNVMQTAYQILVADSKSVIDVHRGNIWDSGKINSMQSAGVLLKGVGLKPNTVYYWTVRVWSNKQKDPGTYANPVMFYTDSALTNHKPAYYPTQITEQKPVSLKKSNGVYRIDFGKDAFGQVKFNLFANRDNDSVTVRIGEVLDASGSVNRKPPGTIRYAQYIIPLRKGLNTYKVKINKNVGNTRPLAIKIPAYIGEVTPFRYCELEGYDHPLKVDDVTRLFAHYPF